MRLTDVLSEATIKVPLAGGDKESIVRELIDVVRPGASRAAKDAVYQSVREREALMSTGIGEGIALPHGSIPAGSPFVVALGIPRSPVDFEAIDGQPVSLIFLLLSDEADNMLKMKALARISRLLHRAEFRVALASARSASEAMRVIVDEEARHRI